MRVVNLKWVVPTLFAACLLACEKKEGPKPEEPVKEATHENKVIILTNESLKNLDLKTEPAIVKGLDQKLKVPGRITADMNRTARVSVTLEGRVIKLNQDIGDRVSKGTLMGEVESPELLDKTLLLQAPIDGIVTAKAATVGELVDKGREIYTLSDLSHLWVIGEVKEKDLALVHPGQKVDFTLLSYPGETFHGAIARVAGAVEENSRTFEIRVEVNGQNGRLKPGMFADIEITTNVLHNALLISDAALQTEGEDQIVFVALDGNRFEKRVVRVGKEQEGRVQVLSGVKVGEKVVTEGSFTLKSEMLKGELGEE